MEVRCSRNPMKCSGTTDKAYKQERYIPINPLAKSFIACSKASSTAGDIPIW